jgi:1-acyl-sn-glycerol-3-phosphate acyltransferase
MRRFFTGFVLGIRVRIFGHRQPLDKRTLIILNHRCHFDWMFLWLVLAKVGDLGMWTVILKKLLKPVPLAGM